jgi:hypothetical protein
VSEPIRRIDGLRRGIDAAAAVERPPRAEREESREEPEPRRRGPRRPPARPAVDGHGHVDVQA